MAISQPPPRARPLIAPIIGFFPSRVERAPKPEGGKGRGGDEGSALLVFHSVETGWPLGKSVDEEGNQGRAEYPVSVPLRSAPAQKARPSPVTIPTRRLGSLSNQVQIASSSAWPALLMQLRDLGRESVTRRTWGAGKASLVKALGGGGRVNLGEDIVGFGVGFGI